MSRSEGRETRSNPEEVAFAKGVIKGDGVIPSRWGGEDPAGEGKTTGGEVMPKLRKQGRIERSVMQLGISAIIALVESRSTHGCMFKAATTRW